MVTVYLGLGSNLGDRQSNLTKAFKLLAEQVCLEQVSSLYETEPVGYQEQPRFLNAVCRVSTSLSPEQLLVSIKGIEATLGRLPSFPNAPRPIDIDILLYGNQVIDTLQLTIPHPRMEERAFVLIPLAELAPELTHPVSGRKVRELVGRVKGKGGVEKWKER